MTNHYEQSEKGKITRKRYQQSEKGKATVKRYQQSEKCHYCPAQAKQYHHHNGYEPEHYLDVVPICIKCHGEINRKA